MAERLQRSSDTPNFDTYPAEPPQSTASYPSNGDTALEQRARQVGAAMGKAVATVRKAQSKVTNIASGSTANASTLTDTAKAKAQEAVDRISGLADNAWSKTQELGQATAAQAEELRLAAQQKAAELRSQIKIGYYRARLRANQTLRDYPLQVVVAAGAIGFLIGLGLRIWRANHEY
jgi:ElaB/YqjD/DUF883 family membrane-anchored ribosome-binding protein